MDSINMQVATRLQDAVEGMERARKMGDEPTSPMELALLTMTDGLVDVVFLLAKEVDTLRASVQSGSPGTA